MTFHLMFAGVLLVGVLIGILICKVFARNEGVLRIDHTDPEKDVYRFDIVDFDRLNKKKKITLKVDNSADLSQD